jgi:hypothetical protein
MPRRQQIRGIKMCAHCGGGYDAFKAMEVRGRYCSPECLESARVAHRLHDAAAAAAADALSALGP